MEKKRVRKFNVKKFLIFIIFLIIIGIFVKYLLNIRVKNIIVLNNSFYNDEEIIETSELDNYPKIIFTSKNKIKKRLKKLDLIEDVKVKMKYNSTIEMDVKEKKVLYYDRANEKYMLSDGSKIELENISGIPTLINYIPSEVEEKFIKEFKKIDIDIISLISEIEYDKTAYDNERFLLTMNDGNQVYINNSRLNSLNKYIEIVRNLDNKKGILYLDTGNYFEVKKK